MLSRKPRCSIELKHGALTPTQTQYKSLSEFLLMLCIFHKVYNRCVQETIRNHEWNYRFGMVGLRHLDLANSFVSIN